MEKIKAKWQAFKRWVAANWKAIAVSAAVGFMLALVLSA